MTDGYWLRAEAAHDTEVAHARLAQRTELDRRLADLERDPAAVEVLGDCSVAH